MKRVLVTGSNGLLGQKLTDIYRAVENVELIATGRAADRYPENNNYEYVTHDITNSKK